MIIWKKIQVYLMEFGPTWRGNGNLEDDFEDMMMTLGIPLHFVYIAWIMKECDWFLVRSLGPHTFDKGAPLVGISYGYLMYLDWFSVILYCVTWRMSHSPLDLRGFNKFDDYFIVGGLLSISYI